MEKRVETEMGSVEIFSYGGILSEELQEIDKLIPESRELELAGTRTRSCGGFFTITCC